MTLEQRQLNNHRALQNQVATLALALTSALSSEERGLG